MVKYLALSSLIWKPVPLLFTEWEWEHMNCKEKIDYKKRIQAKKLKYFKYNSKLLIFIGPSGKFRTPCAPLSFSWNWTTNQPEILVHAGLNLEVKKHAIYINICSTCTLWIRIHFFPDGGGAVSNYFIHQLFKYHVISKVQHSNYIQHILTRALYHQRVFYRLQFKLVSNIIIKVSTAFISQELCQVRLLVEI